MLNRPVKFLHFPSVVLRHLRCFRSTVSSLINVPGRDGDAFIACIHMQPMTNRPTETRFPDGPPGFTSEGYILHWLYGAPLWGANELLIVLLSCIPPPGCKYTRNTMRVCLLGTARLIGILRYMGKNLSVML